MNVLYYSNVKITLDIVHTVPQLTIIIVIIRSDLYLKYL